MLNIKIHKAYRTVVALCDSSLIGRKFESGIYQLDIRENFYKDNEITIEQCIPLLRRYSIEDATFNIVGKEAIKAAEEAGIIKKEQVSYIQDVPFTLVLI